MQPVWFWFQVVATMYGGAGSVYDGQPLYCAGADGPFYSETTAPWVAVDVREFESGRVRCGDRLLIRFQDGEELEARALDAGPFEGYYVPDWPERPIAVDVPAHLWPRAGLAAVVDVANLSEIERTLDARGYWFDGGDKQLARAVLGGLGDLADRTAASPHPCDGSPLTSTDCARPHLLHEMPSMAQTPSTRPQRMGRLLEVRDPGAGGIETQDFASLRRVN